MEFGGFIFYFSFFEEIFTNKCLNNSDGNGDVGNNGWNEFSHDIQDIYKLSS